MQSNQKVALKALVSFIFGMAILTFISGGANALTTPQVEVSYPRGGRVDYEIEAKGKIYAKEQEQITTLEGFGIKEIFVETGDPVKAGDPLYAVDTTAVEDILKDGQYKLKKLMLQMEQLKLNRQGDVSTSPVEEAEKALKKLEEEQQHKRDQEAIKIAQAIEELNQANSVLEEAEADLIVFQNTSVEEALKIARKQVEEANKNVDDKKYEEEKAIKRAEQNLKEAKERLWLLGGGEATVALQAIERAEMELEMTKKDWKREVAEATNRLKEAESLVAQLENGEADIEGLKQEEEKVKRAIAEVKIKQRQLDNAKLDIQRLEAQFTYDQEVAIDELEKAKVQAQKQDDNYQKEVKNQGITEELLQIDIDKQIKDLEDLEKLYQQGGLVLATIDGIVGEINIEVGQKTTDAEGIGIVAVNTEYVFEAMITQDEAKKLEEGDTVSITLENSKFPIQEELVIDRIVGVKESAEKKVIVRIKDVVGESSGTMRIKKQSDTYQTIVPVEAIRQDNEGKFVIVVREEVTTLGTQIIATKVSVTEMERNQEVAAVKGEIGVKDEIVIWSNKPVGVGDVIRVIEQ